MSTRRAILRLAVALVGLPALARFPDSAGDPRGLTSALRGRRGIGALFRQPAAARRVGRRYLATLPPHEARVEVLLDRIGLPGADLAHLDPVPLREQFVAQVRRDFAAGDTVVLEGWIIARTEAVLCALVAVA